MIPCLNNATTGAATFEEFMDVASAARFAAIEVGLGNLEAYVAEHSVSELRQELLRRDLQLGSGGLPVDWKGAETDFVADLEALPKRLGLCQELGLLRLCTWIPPRWDAPYLEVLSFCVERLGTVADKVGEYGIKLGLEFVGPQGNFLGKPYKFATTLAETLHLIEAMGRDNVGLLLDSYHLFVGETAMSELAALPADMIVQFHINDAYPGIPRPQLEDLKRLLPGTGTIPLVPMLKALVSTGYAWTVSIETFNEEVKGLGAKEAARVSKVALDALLDVI